jgi:hypothetical protein
MPRPSDKIGNALITFSGQHGFSIFGLITELV